MVRINCTQSQRQERQNKRTKKLRHGKKSIDWKLIIDAKLWQNRNNTAQKMSIHAESNVIKFW